MKISCPSASTAAWVTSSISSPHPQNIMFLERKRFGNIFFHALFFLWLYLFLSPVSSTHSHTVILNLMQKKKKKKEIKRKNHCTITYFFRLQNLFHAY